MEQVSLRILSATFHTFGHFHFQLNKEGKPRCLCEPRYLYRETCRPLSLVNNQLMTASNLYVYVRSLYLKTGSLQEIKRLVNISIWRFIHKDEETEEQRSRAPPRPSCRFHPDTSCAAVQHWNSVIHPTSVRTHHLRLTFSTPEALTAVSDSIWLQSRLQDGTTSEPAEGQPGTGMALRRYRFKDSNIITLCVICM